jgi:DNA-binding response OmpR family regulator
VGADAYLTDLLRYALTREGYAVEVAASGDGALAVAERWRPHAAIVDGDLPDLGDDDLGAQLQGCHSTTVILLAAGASEEARAAGLMRGASHHMTKPFSLRALVGALATMLQPAAPGL